MTSKNIVLLFHPRTFHERNYRYYHVPYSLLSVASTIDRSTFEVIVWDNNVLGQDSFRSKLTALKRGVLCVGISSMIGHQIEDGLKFAQQISDIDASIP